MRDAGYQTKMKSLTAVGGTELDRSFVAPAGYSALASSRRQYAGVCTWFRDRPFA
jgi:hypothetical protein